MLARRAGGILAPSSQATMLPGLLWGDASVSQGRLGPPQMGLGDTAAEVNSRHWVAERTSKALPRQPGMKAKHGDAVILNEECAEMSWERFPVLLKEEAIPFIQRSRAVMGQERTASGEEQDDGEPIEKEERMGKGGGGEEEEEEEGERGVGNPDLGPEETAVGHPPWQNGPGEMGLGEGDEGLGLGQSREEDGENMAEAGKIVDGEDVQDSLECSSQESWEGGDVEGEEVNSGAGAGAEEGGRAEEEKEGLEPEGQQWGGTRENEGEQPGGAEDGDPNGGGGDDDDNNKKKGLENQEGDAASTSPDSSVQVCLGPRRAHGATEQTCLWRRRGGRRRGGGGGRGL
ncbi:uncharacterized protein LOC128337525 isoform X3 [Hemicordylus capensis]|uniref:uncharacterized protein LOC128337525 isoform X3 n=1 Tax=Hemicordylus capensis TaxID=884348 RepID=UPI00230271EA|nr:uncharacterized protein LOC128337525 isoform X3 [Hemicordylus capensis]